MQIDIEQRVQMARELFKQGYNCAQSVTMVYADCFDLSPELMSRIAISFGGGFGRQREICGTVAGAGVILGLLHQVDPTDAHAAKQDSYLQVQSFSHTFKQSYGSIICRELLALRKGEQCDPTPSDRTPAYYQRRPCIEYVAGSVRVLGQILQQELRDR